jgi:serine/threonine-protein kinase RsbW
MIAASDNVFEAQFINQLPELLRVIEAALAFLEQRGVSTRALNLAHLAVEEMATNILKYSYDDNATHHILLRIRIEANGLLVELEDDGHEFNPLQASQPKLDIPFEDRAPGGVGIHLVRKLATQMDYERRDGLNRLRIKIAT